MSDRKPQEAHDQDDETEEFVIIPEEALHLLPEEWQQDVREKAENGRAVLATVNNELSQLSRLTLSLASVTTLKHIQGRLANQGFEATMDWVFDLEALVTAFVVTYVRLHQGGEESGFARNALPVDLRVAHDEIIELRNKRFAHSGGHHSVSDAMEISHDSGGFVVKMGLSMTVQVGGPPVWKDLIAVLEAIFAERMDKLLKRLEERTGVSWSGMTGLSPA